VNALAYDVEERPFDVDAEHAGTRASIAARTQRRLRATMSRSSLMSVGRKPVVPNCRCARPISRMVSMPRFGVEEHAAAAVDLRVEKSPVTGDGRRGRRGAQP